MLTQTKLKFFSFNPRPHLHPSPNPSSRPSENKEKQAQRDGLRKIAETTLKAIKDGIITVAGISHDLAAKITFSNNNTCYYAADSVLSTWSNTSFPPRAIQSNTEISVLEISTLDGARSLSNTLSSRSTSFGRIALLNFASATNPGGGFQNGAKAQEESIARSSTLYPSLMTDTAQQFYKLHENDRKRGFYHHVMVYTPAVVVFRDDAGGWIEPYEVDVITSAAVNAGDVRKKVMAARSSASRAETEKKIEEVMRERMARILFLFEHQGAKNIVLGSFGTGVFQNSVELVAKIWADLLTADNARFKRSFDRVVFAILGKDTFDTFKQVFEKR
ncbi:hypothetical protein BJ138DRAFT_1155472 [Hygrophoropsis aurantiaca]|uniref:Uncharacterized protein n=1 Tax=Hygrophoropsis aurantiaca TaxID=72124 RepID=A0ACB8A806_9AGAM|nr:hypothetical protein BJ138DRAFT_1155472 [Hygrophoropsis aurantiaca]